MPLPARIVRFGPFQLDLAAAELRKNGTITKLAEQTFQILAELVQHPREVVTRDELRERLWHSDTFVDFEYGLNAAVKRLRDVLGDSADNPIYIETLPRRGYRLMVPVEIEAPMAAGVPKLRLGNWKVWLVGAVAGVVVAALAVGPVRRERSRHVYALKPSDTIVLADFVNSTGDAVFDDTLKQALAVQLEQSPFLNIVSQAKVQDRLRLMGRPPDQRLTPEVGRDLCQRAEGTALIWGSIAKLGSQYVIGLTAVGCRSGSLVAVEQTRADNKENVLKALDKAASSLRNKLGESLSSVERFDTPIWEATTPSLEALKAFSQGRKAWYDQGTRAAITSMQRAIELDPNFALAYGSLGAYQYHLGRYDLAKDAFEKAFALRDRVSELERRRISAVYYGLAVGDLERSIQEFQLLAQTYPNYDLPHFDIGDSLPDLGRWEEAATEMRETLRLNPDHFVAYADLAIQYLALNRPDLAEATVKQALLHNGDHSWLRGPMYHLAFLRGDTKQMAQLVQEAAGKEDERALLSAQADTEAYYGRLNRARHFSRRAQESELRTASAQPAVLEQVKAGLREAEFGNLILARREIAVAMATTPTWQVRSLAALALARIGDTGRAQALVEEMEEDNPSNTRLNVYWLPTIKAAVEMKQGHPDRAITILEETLPYELGAPAPLDLGTFYPAYLRGQAYLMKHNGSAAAREFQKLLDHQGVVLNYPLGALAHLQLGRAYAMSGDTGKAKAAYQDFLTLWKDADSDIPILKQAKPEYAKLQ